MTKKSVDMRGAVGKRDAREADLTHVEGLIRRPGPVVIRELTLAEELAAIRKTRRLQVAAVVERWRAG
jgi:hypothetical protein